MSGAAEASELEPRLPPAKLWLDGDWVEPENNRTFTTENPATEEAICEVASASAADAVSGTAVGCWVSIAACGCSRDEERAVFISINGEPTGPFFDDLTRAWTEWEETQPGPAPAPRTELADARDAWRGVYVPNRRVRSTFMNVLTLGQHVTVQPDDAGGLTVSGPLSPKRRLDPRGRGPGPYRGTDESGGAPGEPRRRPARSSS